MKKTIRAKLKESRGETIAEVLIAMLVAVLAGTMLVAMISVSANAVQTGRKTMSAYYEGLNSPTGITGTQVAFAWEEMNGAEQGQNRTVSIPAKYYKRAAVGGVEVITYEYQKS